MQILTNNVLTYVQITTNWSTAAPCCRYQRWSGQLDIKSKYPH